MRTGTNSKSRRRVLLVTEGAYPFHWGGLSTWCDRLVTELDEVDFSVLAIAEAPGLPRRFDFPPNVTEFLPTPIWGLRNAWEVEQSRGIRTVVRRRRRTNDDVVERDFLPFYTAFLAQILRSERPERTAARIAARSRGALISSPDDDHALVEALHAMYTFFREHDFDVALRSRGVWDAVVQQANEAVEQLAAEHELDSFAPSAGEIAAAMQWIYHWLFPIARQLPEVDVAHATMVGIPSLVCVVTQAEHGSTFLLSEHGIFLREAYLAEHGGRGSLFLKTLKLRFARRMTELAYAKADAVAPCCDYNHRWEKRNGARPERIRTAYYGFDPDAFEPAPPCRAPDAAPVVVWAGRIDPLKDLETLLQAAALVLRDRPGARFRLYGNPSAGNESYMDRCMGLHTRLGLAGTVTFEGYADSLPAVFAEADLVVLSSISEGFPYSTLEAMLCGKPIVTTGVGGIREQVSSSARVVRPRDPQALGAAILEILDDAHARDSLARSARERAASLFTLERFRAAHRELYAVSRAAESPDPSSGADGARATSSLENGRNGRPQEPPVDSDRSTHADPLRSST